MKKWIYVLAPVCMLVVFLFFYFSFSKQLEERERVVAAKVAADKKAEDERKAAIETKAREDAERRAAARAAEEAKKEADRLAKWNAESQKIQDATDSYNKEADALAKTVSDLTVQLDALRKAKETANRDYLEAIKRVERARIAKRTAEFEIQRMTDMIASRAANSAMARPPAAPASKS